MQIASLGRLTHLISADNLFLLAESIEELKLAWTEVSIALRMKELRWKPGSLEILSSEPRCFETLVWKLPSPGQPVQSGIGFWMAAPQGRSTR